LLARTDAIANLAVKDLEEARDFYENILGFTQADSEGDELVTYRSGATSFNVYRSEYAGTNKATAVTWAVGDRIEAVAEALAARGVRFEHFEMDGMTLRGDVHEGDGMRVAWFKDPDGNILNIVSG